VSLVSSLVAGILAEDTCRARPMASTSLMALCLCYWRPACRPWASTSTCMTWGTQTLQPRHRETTTWTASAASFSPHGKTGRLSQGLVIIS